MRAAGVGRAELPTSGLAILPESRETTWSNCGSFTQSGKGKLHPSKYKHAHNGKQR